MPCYWEWIKKSEAADKGVVKTKLFVKSSFEEQFSGHLAIKISYWKFWKVTVVNSKEHSPQNFFQRILWHLSAIAKKCPSSQIELKLNSFSDSKAGHCKNFSGLTRKICSKTLQKVRPVTLTKNIFLKTSEGQLFSEKLKDKFFVDYSCFQEFLGQLLILLLQWRKISQVIKLNICPEVSFLLI